MYRVVNGIRKENILQVNFTTEDGIWNPEASFILIILRNKALLR